eukprot:snap_masked-scaffold_2-processed-gene-21.6-mRNA-1 protein AED:1.00 eAED:1.00 QI:0/-1/0/0/-1/1/1/0/145
MISFTRYPSFSRYSIPAYYVKSSNQVKQAPYRKHLAVDISEKEEEYVLKFDVPGFMKSDIDISIDKNTLKISVLKKKEDETQNEEEKQNKEDFILVERKTILTERSFELPDDVDTEKIDAKCEHGVLTLTLQKKEAEKPRKIRID